MRGRRNCCFTLVLIAFGVGLLIAMLCSFRLVVVTLALALIFVGIIASC